MTWSDAQQLLVLVDLIIVRTNKDIQRKKEQFSFSLITDLNSIKKYIKPRPRNTQTNKIKPMQE